MDDLETVRKALNELPEYFVGDSVYAAFGYGILVLTTRDAPDGPAKHRMYMQADSWDRLEEFVRQAKGGIIRI